MPMKENDKPLMIVTGSSGLIGKWVVKAFSPSFKVIGIDRNATEDPGDNFIKCDLTNDVDTDRAFAEVREYHGNQIASVIHLASHYDFSGEPSPLYRKLTVEGTRRVLRALKQFPVVEQFIFTSTLLVMEPAVEEEEVLTEKSPLEDEPWDYPRSKIEAEEMIRKEHAGIPAVILRIAGVYNEEGNSIPITQHIARIYEKQLESYFFPGDADHGTPYVHLNDLADCFLHVVEKRKTLGSYSVFLVAEPDIMSYNELQEQIGELIHEKQWPTFRIPKIAAKAGAWAKEKVAGDGETFIKPWMVDLADAHYPVAIKHAEERLGWRPRYRLRGTIPEMIRRLKANPKKFYETNELPLPDELKGEEINREKESRA